MCAACVLSSSSEAWGRGWTADGGALRLRRWWMENDVISELTGADARVHKGSPSLWGQTANLLLIFLKFTWLKWGELDLCGGRYGVTLRSGLEPGKKQYKESPRGRSGYISDQSGSLGFTCGSILTQVRVNTRQRDQKLSHIPHYVDEIALFANDWSVVLLPISLCRGQPHVHPNGERQLREIVTGRTGSASRVPLTVPLPRRPVVDRDASHQHTGTVHSPALAW